MKIANEKKLEQDDDGYNIVDFRKPVQFPLAINSNYNFNQLYVHVNSLITFEGAISHSRYIGSDLYNNTFYIAPLWSDIDINLRGQIVHGQLEDLKCLKNLINAIKQATNLDKSKISLCLLVIIFLMRAFRFSTCLELCGQMDRGEPSHGRRRLSDKLFSNLNYDRWKELTCPIRLFAFDLAKYKLFQEHPSRV